MSRRMVINDGAAVEEIANTEECRHKIDRICCCEKSCFYEMKVDKDICDRCHDFEQENGIAKMYITSKLYSKGEYF